MKMRNRMKIHAEIYNYTNGETYYKSFPMSDDELDKLMKSGEVMVDACGNFNFGTDFGSSVPQFNEAIKQFEEKGIQELDLSILSKTYLFNEIVEGIDNMLIIDFDAETESWASSDFYSDDDKGRTLYLGGYAGFPVSVPEPLEPYMDYGALWRDSEINMGLRCVTNNEGHYIVSLQ